jgi:hypothetical protein
MTSFVITTVMLLMSFGGFVAMQPDSGESTGIQINGSTETNSGRLPLGQSSVCAVEIRNTTEMNARIRLVKSTCPCVNVSISQAEISKAQSANVSISVSVSPVTGVQAHAAEFAVDFIGKDGSIERSTRFVLKVSYVADLALVVEPKMLWATVVSGQTAVRSIFSRSSGLDALNLRVESVSLDLVQRQDRKRFDIHAPARDAESVFVDKFVFTGERPGAYEGSILLRTDDPDLSEYKIPVRLRVLDRVVATPAGFGFVYRYDRESSKIVRTVRLEGRDARAIPDIACRVLDDRGEPLSSELLTLSIKRDGDAVLVSATLDTAKAGDAGVVTVQIHDASDRVIIELPLAWIQLK